MILENVSGCNPSTPRERRDFLRLEPESQAEAKTVEVEIAPLAEGAI
jgi:hypothetical protein